MRAATSHGDLVFSDVAAAPDASYKLYKRHFQQQRPDVGVVHAHALYLLVRDHEAVLVRWHVDLRSATLTGRD
jgi:hypothetical protein